MESNIPMILAMTGPSSNKKSEVARKLAASLQCYLIDEDDIIPSIQKSIPSSYINNDLGFKIASQISSTQLDLKLTCIINTPLSKSTQFHYLMELASSKSASLIIIECVTPNALAPEWYSVIGKVPKLSIDITETFTVEDFVPKMLKVAEADKLSKASSSSAKQLTGDNTIVGRNFIDRHAHEFSFIAKPEIAGFDKLPCSNCKKFISGGTYKCLECDEFILHKACAELPDLLHDLWNKCPPFLKKKNPTEYSFPKEHKCSLCEKFFIFCPDCLFQTHIDCGLLPTIFRDSRRHRHALNFVIMPSWFNFQYKCFRCHKYGNSISYKCYKCKFDLHVNCAFEGSFLEVVTGTARYGYSSPYLNPFSFYEE